MKLLCRVCKNRKVAKTFRVGYVRKDGSKLRSLVCGACTYKLSPKVKRTPVQAQDFNRRRLYGITSVQWEIRFNKQGRRCKICRRNKTAGRGWHTDHKGKKVRGILCHNCNVLIGLAHDSVHILRSAILYVRYVR